jgi:hypothetical protein
MEGKQYINSLFESSKIKKQKKKPYKKPAAVKQLEDDYFTFQYQYKPNIPENIKVKDKLRDDTANGLTKCITTFLKIQGAFASRINTTGIYRADLGKYVRNTQRSGIADIIATYKGLSFQIEVKIGKDKMSQEQLKIKNEFEQSGGYYYIAKDFTSFKNWWQNSVQA